MDENINEDASTTSSQRTLYEDISQSMYLESLTIREQNPIGQSLICSDRSSSQFESIEDEMDLKSFVDSKSSATHSPASAAEAPTLSMKKDDAPQGDIEQNNLNSLITLPIPDSYIEKLCFTETLIVSKSLAEPSSTDLELLVDPGTSQEVGGACISIENVGNNLITYSTKQFSTNDGPQASSLLSIADKNLTLLEERNTETICDSDNNDSKKEQCLHIYKAMEKLIAWRRVIENGTAWQHRGEVSIPVPETLILDGQSLVLMRYLILCNFSGEIETYCIHISGDVCRCVYGVGKEINLMVINTQHKMVAIQKTIYRNLNKPITITYYFLPSGHIAKQTASNSNYFLHMNPLSKIPPSFIIDLEKNWKHDIQLYSEYLDYKQKELDKLTNFSNQQSQFKDMIKDYLVCLLQLKPKYPLDFTIEYFMNLNCDEDNESPT